MNTLINKRTTPLLLTTASALVLLGTVANADSDTWDGGNGTALWSDSTNWLGDGIVPGTTETATFNAVAGAGGAVIDLSGGVTVSSLVFDTATAAAYTIGAGAVGTDTLTLDNGGNITMNSTVENDQLINANIVLGNDATASTYIINNGSPLGSLEVAGAITGATGGVQGAKTINVNGATATNLSGNISDGGALSVGITKNGAGTLTLSGDNTYTGATTVNSGTLNIHSATAIGTGQLNLSGGTFDNTSGSALTLANNNAIAWGNNISGIFFGGSNDLDLGSGAVTLNLAAGGATNTLTLNGTGVTLTMGDVAGSNRRANQTVAVEGAGNTLVMNSLAMNANTAKGSKINSWAGSADILVKNGISGGGKAAHQFRYAGSATFTIDGASTYTGNTTIASGSVILGQGGTTGSLHANSNIVNNGNLTINRSNAAVQGTDFSTAAITGTGSFTQAGSGTTILTNGNEFTGATLISAGSLQLGNGGSAGSLNGTSSVTNNGNLTVNRSNEFTQVTDLNGAAITGSGSFTQAGTGTTTLNAINTFTGATTVSAGTLVIDGAGSINTTSGVNVESAGTFNYNSSTALTAAINFVGTGNTLSGSGTINSAVTISDGNILAIGNSPGTMIFGDTLTLEGSTITEIDGTAGAGVAGGHDFADVTNLLTYGGDMTLDIGTIFAAGDYTFDLFDFGSESGDFASIVLADQYSGSLLDGDLDGIWDLTDGNETWQFVQSTGVLTLNVVPEPSSCALLAGLLGLSYVMVRRRQS